MRRLRPLILAALLCIQPAGALAQQRGGTLVVALNHDIDTLNVYSTGYTGDVQAAVVEGLLAPDAHARYVPVLATEVPTLDNGGIVLSPDGKRMRITYHLRDGVRWSDGEPFTAADVKFTWEALKNPDFVAESKEGVEDVESIDTPDPLTVVVNYRTIAPNFASTLFTFGIFPRHALVGKDLNSDVYNERPLGTGPFMVTEFRRGQYVVCERNPHYWRRDANGTQLPYLDRIIFKIIPDTNTLLTQLRANEVQFASSVPYAHAPQLRALGTLDLIENQTLSWQHIDFNLKGPAPLRDLTVRRAIAMGINKAAIVRALGGYPKPIKSPVVPLLDLHAPDTPDIPYDPVQANALLDAAGYRRGEDGVREKDGVRLSFTIVGQAGKMEDQISEQVMAYNMKAIGVEFRLDNKAGVAFREARYKGKFDILYGTWITSPDPDYGIFFETGGANNGQGYSNPELDRVFKDLRHTIDLPGRQALAARFQAIVANDLPTVSLTTNPLLIAKTKALQNFTPNPTNMTNFVDASGWWLKK